MLLKVDILLSNFPKKFEQLRPGQKMHKTFFLFEGNRFMGVTPIREMHYIEAFAGCGKTTWICQQVESLIKKGISPRKILLLSFSRQAVIELTERLAEGITIFTYHAIALKVFQALSRGKQNYKILDDIDFQHFFLELDFNNVLTEDERAFVNFISEVCHKSPIEILERYISEPDSSLINWQKSYLPRATDWQNFDKYIRPILSLKSKGINDCQTFYLGLYFLDSTSLNQHFNEHLQKTARNYSLAIKAKVQLKLKTIWAKYKKKNHLISFTDLVAKLSQLNHLDWKTNAPWFTEKQYFFFDEFQDTGKFIWQNIVHGLPHNSHLYLVCDPRQAIYGFRSAGYTDFLETKHLYAPYVTHEYQLAENYRSDKNLLHEVNDILLYQAQKFQLDFKPLCFSNQVRSINLCGKELPNVHYIENSNWNQLCEVLYALQLNGTESHSNKNKLSIAILAQTNREVKKIQFLLDLHSGNSISISPTFEEYIDRICRTQLEELKSKGFSQEAMNLIMLIQNTGVNSLKASLCRDLRSTYKEEILSQNTKSMIEVMTIHQAKGKEFDIVCLPVFK